MKVPSIARVPALPNSELASRSALEAALDAAEDCVIITDHSLRIQYANARARKLLVTTEPGETSARLNSVLRLLDEDRITPTELPVAQTILTQESYNTLRPLFAEAKNGSLITVDISIVPTAAELIWRIHTLSAMEEIKRQIVLQASLLDHVTESVVATDINANITYWNKAAEKLYGWKAEEVLGHNVYDLIIPESDRIQAREGFLRWTDDEPRTGESVELRKDGSTFTSHTRISVVRDFRGERIGFVGLARDLTYEKAAKEDLSQTISLLHATLQSTMEGVLAVDLKGRITAWNEQFQRMWGIPHDVISSGSDATTIEAVLDQLSDPGQFVSKIEYLYSEPEAESSDSITFKDGRVFERSSKPQRVDGIPVGRVWSFRDVSSLYQTQEKLRDQKSLYESLLNAQSEMGAGLAIASPEKVLYVNHAITDIAGYSEDELYAIRSLLEILHPDDRPALGARLARRMGGENVPSHYETRILHRDGRALDVEVAVMRREAPHDDQLVILLRDITERKRIERSLIASESKFRTVIDNLGEAIVITDKDDKVLYLNSTLEELSGFSAAECLGQNGPALMTLPVEQPLNEARLGRRLCGERESYELLLKRKNGALRWCSVNAVPYYDLDGSIIGTVAAITDIHQQKQKELELQRAEERFRYVTLATNDAVYDWSIDTNIVWWNDAFVKLFGHSIESDNITLEIWASWVHPEDHDRVTRGLTDALSRGKQVWSDEYRFRRANGTYAFVIDRGYILHDEAGHPYRMIGAMMDVTDRRRAEDELRMAAANTSALIENTTDAILSVDRDLKLVTFNASFYEMFSLHNNEAPYPGMSLATYFRQNESEYWDDIFRRALSGEHFTIERTRTTDPTGERIFEMSFNPIMEDTAVVGIAIFDKDITERKRMELQLIAAKEQAEEMSRLKSTFLANMSHEIRTPMTAILGYGEMLLDPRQTRGDRERCVTTIRRNSEHLLAIINDILDISKIEACRMAVENIPCELPQLIGDVISLVQSRAVEKGLALKVELDGEIPRRIQTDPLRVKQVLVNLLGNAIKFTPPGGSICVKVGRHVQYFSHTIRFDVADTGVGMTDGQIRKLFQPFTQADESTTRRFGGTGLGLTISKRLAKLLGGDIDVASTPGQGSTFSFMINGGPRDGAELITTLDGLDLGAPPAPSPHVPDGSLRGRVLLAEDGEDNQELLGGHLRAAGADVTIAPNGREAVDFVKAAFAAGMPYDLILMDMQMPELDGYGAARELRGAGVATPVVALTANAMAEDRGKCLAAGCTEYLAKPVERGHLLEMVARFLPKAADAKAQAVVESAESTGADSTVAAPAPSSAASSAPLPSAFATDPKYGKLLERFVSRLPERVSKLVRLTRAGDLEGLRQAVHQLKGAGHGYGFAAITDLASRAEEAIKARAAMADIDAAIQALIGLIRQVDGYDAARESADGPNPTEPLRDAAAA